MRYDENKSFPYPVLREGSEDYVDGAFQATLRYALSKDAQKIRVEADFITSEPAIEKLLQSKKAEFALLIDARETYFRDLITTRKRSAKREYDGGQIKGPVTLLAYIVATQDIKDYRSELFNHEYAGRSFRIESGDVIALDRPREFYVGQEVFAHIGTVFELVEEDGIAEGEIKLGLEDDKVQIRVSPEQKALLDTARGQKKTQPILLSGVYLPTLMQVLAHMSRGVGDFEDKKWYRAIISKCEIEGVELNEETDLLAVAQKLLSFPMNSLNEMHFESD